MAIKVLEQYPCDDVINRQAVLSMQYRIDDSATLSTRDVVNVDDIEDLPPVMPRRGIDRDFFQECYKKWVLQQESEE